MARWYYNILSHPRVEIAVCLSTAGLLPYTNPRYGFFVCFAATRRAEPRLGGGGYVQGAQALVRRQIHRAELGGGEDPRPPNAQALNESTRDK